MSEITKLYENAGIKQTRMCEWTCKDSIYCSPNCKYYESTLLYYPPFTAEKQLNILKILSFRQGILLKQHRFFIGWEYNDPDKLICSENSDLNFEEGLAMLVNYLWQDLTEEEKQQVKGILE